MQRTVRLRLHPTQEQADALRETTHAFTQAFNAVCSYGWRERDKIGVRLHHATYRDQKTALPRLVSDLHIQARVKATEAVKSALVRQRKGLPASCPRSTQCPPRFNCHTFRLDWEDGTVRLSTVAGRQTVPIALPPHAEQYRGCAADTADLIERDGVWWLHVVVTVPAPVVESVDVVVGVDLGLAHPAVTSTNRFLGERRWRNLDARTFRLRRALQAKGTKSAKRQLKRLRHKQARRRRDHDHVLSKRLVESVPAGATVVLENLTNIRSRVRQRHRAQSRRLHGWSFAQLRGFIAYKAEARGVTVAAVDPRHTSQTCSACGYRARTNRRSQGDFWCRACGFRLNADLNGARNIAAKYRAGVGISQTSWSPVMRPIAVAPPEPTASRLL